MLRQLTVQKYFEILLINILTVRLSATRFDDCFIISSFIVRQVGINTNKKIEQRR